MYLLGADGELLYSRGEEMRTADRSSRAVLGAVSGQESQSLYVHQVEEDGEYKSVGDYAVPVFRDGEIWYIVLLRQSVTDIEETMQNNVMIILMASLLAIAVSAILAYILAAGIARPIQRLNRRTKELATGNLDAADDLPKHTGSADEIEELENNFGHMAQELSRILSETSSEKNKLETIFHYMADGLVVYDVNGYVVQCNPAALELMGKGIRNESFGEAFPKEHFAALLYSPSGTIAERMLELDGHAVRAEFAAYGNKDGASEGLIVVLQDVTEQRRAEAMQREFVANVSHELRTPITSVRSYAETLVETPGLPAETSVKFLNVILNESDRMTHIVDDLLTLSRFDSGYSQLNLTTFPFADVLEDSYQAIRIEAQRHDHTLILEGEQVLPTVRADRERVLQVIMNILSNAIKYTPVGSVIQISAYRKDHQVVVEVADNGPGIPDRAKAQVFEMFYTGQSRIADSHRSLGLGLPLCRAILTAHGGTLTLRDNIPNGSVFSFALPQSEVNIHE
mgnify:CR=1 FL=1